MDPFQTIDSPLRYPKVRSSAQIRRELNSDIDSLTETSSRLQELGNSFRCYREIWPDQCDRLDAAVQKHTAIFSSLAMLLDDSQSLPLEIITLRYDVVVEVHYLIDRANQTLQHLARLRGVCRTRSTQAYRQQQIVATDLDKLIEHSTELKREILTLIDRARFRESEIQRESR